MSTFKNKLSSPRSEDGFTLIEILVVVFISGVLLAIAVPTFLSQRKNAVDDSIRQDIKNIVAMANSVKANSPNANFIVYKNNKICTGSGSTAPTTCPATSPSPVVSMNGNYVISGGKSGPTSGEFYVSGWASSANKYDSSANRLLYASGEKVFKECPAC